VNHLNKLVCLVALTSFANASEVAVNSSIAVVQCAAAEKDAGSSSLTGASLGVAYVHPASADAEVYGGVNVFLHPALVSTSGPRVAAFNVGAAFKPVSNMNYTFKVGLVAQAAVSADVDSEAAYTAGFQVGSVYGIAPGYDAELMVSQTFPAVAASENASYSIAVGLTKTIAVEV